jgi:hypothetical protein
MKPLLPDEVAKIKVPKGVTLKANILGPGYWWPDSFPEDPLQISLLRIAVDEANGILPQGSVGVMWDYVDVNDLVGLKLDYNSTYSVQPMLPISQGWRLLTARVAFLGWHVYKNDADTIFGLSLQEALEAYSKETGYLIGEYEDLDPKSFEEVPLDTAITVNDEDYIDRKRTLSAAGWVLYSINVGRSTNKDFSRLICSTDI